jgi:hypothetical protein
MLPVVGLTIAVMKLVKKVAMLPNVEHRIFVARLFLRA